MPFSLKEILKREDIKTFVFDKGFVSFRIEEYGECNIYAYYVSRESKVSSKEHRVAFYDFLKANGVKLLKAYTHVPPKVWKGWGFKFRRYEIVKEL